MTTLRSDIPSPPPRMAKLPIDHRGYPVPRFVAKVGGEWDFRVVEPRWLERCVRFNVCWLCGERLGKHLVFVVGPMCVVNRASGEPPCHLECAQYAARACPFMVTPRRKRNEKNLPEDGAFNPAGLARNPGAVALYVTRAYKWLRGDGVIRMGEPERVEWWAEGRAATRAEIEQSIQSGLPLLRAEEEGPAAVKELERMVERAMPLLPA